MTPDADGRTTFLSETEATTFLVRALAERLRRHPGVQADAAAIAAEGVLIDREEYDNKPPGPASAPAMVPGVRWVIRADDLKLFDAAADVLGKLLAAGLTGALMKSVAGGVAAATPALIDLSKLLKRARSKGAFLDARAFTLLTTLRANGPMSFDSLALLLRAFDGTWSREEVAATLERLKALPASDGSSLALVAVDGDQWRVAGI